MLLITNLETMLTFEEKRKNLKNDQQTFALLPINNSNDFGFIM